MAYGKIGRYNLFYFNRSYQSDLFKIKVICSNQSDFMAVLDQGKQPRNLLYR